jgi:hypothetical protein
MIKMQQQHPKTMKTLALTLALLLGIATASAASTHRDGNKELMKKINTCLTFSAKERKEVGAGIAVVTFSINNQGHVNIISIDASNEKQKELITQKLDQYYVENAPVISDTLYSIQIHFGQ